MCSIWGLGLLNGSVLDDTAVLKHLIVQLGIAGESRGRQATGVAFGHKDKIAVSKRNVNAETFFDSDEFNLAFDKYGRLDNPDDDGPISIIGHNRFKTKGTLLNNDNNHPIVTENVVGVHNGCIANDDQLFRELDLFRRAQVDSEILFRLLDRYINGQKMNYRTAIHKLSRNVMGSYAFAAINRKQPYMLYLVKGSSPLFVRRYYNLGIYMFASTEEMLNAATKDVELGKHMSKLIPHDTAFCIDLFINSENVLDISNKTAGAYA